MTHELLRIRNLTLEARAGNDWHPIVQDIDLTLARGEVLGLIGESGAGKSSLGLAAAGFTRPGCRVRQGEVWFDGVDLLKAGERHCQQLRGRRIAYVAQSAAAAFNPARRLLDQTIESALAQGLPRSTAHARARQLYRQLSLPDPDTFGDRYPHQASGGQLQRAMTAMAMICQPDLIIFDEPTTALDVTTQVDVLAAIRDAIQHSGSAALYITHDLAVVAQMAQRIMVLKHGKRVEEAPTGQMLEAPTQAYTRSLWAVRQLIKAVEPPPSAQILSVEHLSAHYGQVQVLDDINITVPQGQTTAIIGESGSGKSTLARCITGLLGVSGGTVRFADQLLAPRYSDRPLEQLRQIQLVYQSADTALNPKQTVRELIGRPLAFYHALDGARRQQRLLELMEMIELPAAHLSRLPGELSGGQKQRVAIARALAAEPRLIICDEVTSALDKLIQQGIINLLLRLQKELDVSYLFITHDIATVRAIADRVVVMHRGRVVQQGSREEVLKPPHPAYTEHLLACEPQMQQGWLDAMRPVEAC